MLGKYCGKCHGAAAIANGTVMGGFDSVEDMEELVMSGYIIPRSPGTSLLVQRIRSGDMPPAGVMPRPSQTEIRALEAYVSGTSFSF
jgi:mono/diheme cytochrome c family protein